jgi:hypothetical protein
MEDAMLIRSIPFIPSGKNGFVVFDWRNMVDNEIFKSHFMGICRGELASLARQLKGEPPQLRLLGLGNKGSKPSPKPTSFS